MNSSTLNAMRAALPGTVTGPADPGYGTARRIYNAMIDRHPAAIVSCGDVGQVAATVAFARDHGLELAVRGGGHSGPGLCLVDDGITLDLSPMRAVQVDPDARIARVGGGALLSDLDRATHEFGLATPAGIVSTTGVGGLTLGGGHGYLTRRYGLTVDNLLSAEVVLADGRVVTADEQHEPELFWALRGGGGNFGVVTAFTYRLHPVDTVGMGVTLWPVERTRDVLAWYREYLPAASDDVYGFFAVLVVPPAPPFPPSTHGHRMCAVVWCLTGDLAPLNGTLDVVNQPATPAFHFTSPMPYPDLQQMFDGLIPPGLQWYWRGDFFDRIDDELLDVHRRYGESIPTALSTMHLYPVDGAAHRVDPDATAFSHRDAVWSGIFAGIDDDPAHAGLVRDWSVNYWTEAHPHSMGGAYVNFLGADEGGDRVRATYRGHYERLAQVKRAYDPDNLFHANQNILPAPANVAA
jgi:FAD/FMN-containing dehydrogenase